MQFNQEDVSKFKQRREVAEKARFEAKQIMRLDFFVDKQPHDAIRVIRKESIRKIHESIVDGLPASVPFPDQDTKLGRLLRILTADIIQFYTRTMKRTVLLSKLSGPYKDTDIIDRYQ